MYKNQRIRFDLKASILYSCDQIIRFVISPYLIFILILSPFRMAAQTNLNDSLKLAEDYYRLATSQLNISNYSSSGSLFERGAQLAAKGNNSLLEVRCLIGIGKSKFYSGDIEGSISIFNKAVSLCEKEELSAEKANILLERGHSYASEIHYHEAISDYKTALKIYETERNDSGQINAYISLGQLYLTWNDFYNGISFYKTALDIAEQKGFSEKRKEILNDVERAGKFSNSLGEDSERSSQENDRMFWELKKMAAKDSVDRLKKYQAELIERQKKQEMQLIKNKLSIAAQDEKIQELALRDEQSTLKNVNLEKKEKEKQLLISENDKKIQDAKNAALLYSGRIKLYSSLVTLFLIFLVVLFLWRNNLNKQRANRLLQVQKEDTELQKNMAEENLRKLRSTQAQLIQTEKMASLRGTDCRHSP